MIKIIFQTLGIVMMAVLLHEAGHTIAAILCGVKVTAFGIGFGRPYIHKKIWGIDFRLSPWLLGGYTSMKGEYDKAPDGFLAQTYGKKVIIVLAGVLMNLLVAFICYLIAYKDIVLGIWIDWNFIYAAITKNYDRLYAVYLVTNPNLTILTISSFNLMCVLFNLIPFPCLDGSLLWILRLEKYMKFKKFVKVMKYLCWSGFVVLMVGQFVLLYWWWIA